MRGNGDLHGRGRLTATLIWEGVGVSNASDLGRRLYAAAGLPATDHISQTPGASTVWLGDVSLLHSRARAILVGRRDSTIRVIQREVERASQRAPLRMSGEGQLSMQGRQLVPRWAVRAPDETGRAVVMVTFGHNADDVEVVGLSVPDAYNLVQMVERALACPLR
ncbi:MAG: hypothetical protein ACRDZZ_02455 [Ilumatobacteraceae bacterium]